MLKNRYLKFLSYLCVAICSIQNLYCDDFQHTDNLNGDYKTTTITSDTELVLNSGWEFYWKEFITPGNFEHKKPLFTNISLKNWTQFELSDKHKLSSFGFATYRLNISIIEKRPSVSLYIPKIYAASKVFINGELVSEVGRVGKTQNETLHRRFSQIIPLNTNENNFEIVIQVANFYHNKAGINEPLIIGASQHLHSIKSKRIIADMLFIGCLGFIGLFFLFFHLLYWNKDKAVLYFAILCLAMSYMALSDRYAPLTVIFKSINWIFLTKIEYLSLFLAGAGASLFFKDIFRSFVHKLYSRIMIFGFCILGIVVVFLPAPYFTKMLLPFFVFMIINLTYVAFVIIKAILNKRYESILLLVSMLLGSVIFSIHIFYFLGNNENAIIYVNFGYIIVFLLLSMLLMTRFSNSFQELEKSRELALQQKKEISIKSNQLSDMNLQLEENLRLLEDYNAELDDFNHIVSHDLKSPLVSVYSLVSFIEEDLSTSLDVSTKEHMQLLKEVVSKMDALINGLLEYSKVAKSDKSKEVFWLHDLLDKVKGVVDYQNKSTINFPKKDIEVFASKIELEHVFQNLISNAIKHNDKEKAIINISANKLKDEYVFSVSDNGPGINPKYHTKIFKIFSQLNLNKDVESTGIGLAIVKKIISKNHGAIKVASEKGNGITIEFSWKI